MSLVRIQSSAPMNVRFSPMMTRGIWKRMAVPEHIGQGLSVETKVSCFQSRPPPDAASPDAHDFGVGGRVSTLETFVVAAGYDLPFRVHQDGADRNASLCPGLFCLGERGFYPLAERLLMYGTRSSLKTPRGGKW